MKLQWYMCVFMRLSSLCVRRSERAIKGRIELTDVATERDLNLMFEGIHFVSNGSIYGFAEPNRSVMARPSSRNHFLTHLASPAFTRICVNFLPLYRIMHSMTPHMWSKLSSPHGSQRLCT